MQVTVAAVQATPVFLDTEATVEKACGLIKEAAGQAARLIVFPEAFVPTYPDWVWRLPAWGDGQFMSRLYDQAVSVPGPIVTRLGEAAREAAAYVVMGINEIEGGTLYNTLIYLAPDGSLAGKHRKLMPTGGERTVWGYGDGSTLGVMRTPFGVVGGLICWENYMPLARAAMYAQGMEILVAPTWDNDETWISTLRHIAKEGRCYVIGVSPVLRGADVPEDLRGEIYRDATGPAETDWMSRGLGTVVAPGGEILAGPLRDQEGIVLAVIDVEQTVQAHRRMFDPVGHYARPDVFTLSVNTRERRAVVFDSAGESR